MKTTNRYGSSDNSTEVEATISYSKDYEPKIYCFDPGQLNFRKKNKKLCYRMIPVFLTGQMHYVERPDGSTLACPYGRNVAAGLWLKIDAKTELEAIQYLTETNPEEIMRKYNIRYSREPNGLDGLPRWLKAEYDGFAFNIVLQNRDPRKWKEVQELVKAYNTEQERWVEIVERSIRGQ